MFRAVILATIIGAIVRAIHVFGADFPLNDGALFLTMTEDLVANGFVVPITTTYNQADIPFLYPPLGFYAAGLASLTGVDLVTILRLAPFMVSLLTVPAVYLLGTVALPTRFAALVAAVAFAIVPRAFDWVIAGGGLTRAPGLLLAILFLWAALRLERRPSLTRCVTVGVLAALAALSHPGAVLTGALWAVALVATSAARRRTFFWMVGAAFVAFLGVFPWLATIVSTHGFVGLLGAGQTGVDIQAAVTYLFGFGFTDEPFVTIIAALALLGIMLRARDGSWRLALLVAVVLVDPRNGLTYSMAIIALCAAVAVTELLLPAFDPRPVARATVWPDSSISRPARAMLGVILVIGFTGAIAARADFGTPMFALPTDTRAAMARVAQETPSDAAIIVVSGTGWWIDATSEWFPVLADRTSVATVQGTEWTGTAGWALAEARHTQLQSCAFASVACFESWRATHASDASFVFLTRGVPSFSPLDSECCPALRSPLRMAGYRVVFDTTGGTLLAIPR